MAGEVIYFISDTHLGDGTGADRFSYPHQLIDLLSRIEAEPKAHLVLLGDLMELWAANLEAVLVRHAPLFHAVARVAAKHAVTYVVGNHDCLPWYYFIDQGLGRVQIAERFTSARGNLVAVHGHQFDPFNRIGLQADGDLKIPWTRKLVKVIGFVERIGGQTAGDAITDLGEIITKAAASIEAILPDWGEEHRKRGADALERTKDILARQAPCERGYPPAERIYADGARELMVTTRARYVVMGHTHHPLRLNWGSRSYVNVGSWVSDQYPPTYGRFADGKLELLNANDHQPFVERPKPAVP